MAAFFRSAPPPGGGGSPPAHLAMSSDRVTLGPGHTSGLDSWAGAWPDRRRAQSQASTDEPGPAATGAPSSRAPRLLAAGQRACLTRRQACGERGRAPIWRERHGRVRGVSDAARTTRRCQRDAPSPCRSPPCIRCNPIARPCIHTRIPHPSDTRRGAASLRTIVAGRLRPRIQRGDTPQAGWFVAAHGDSRQLRPESS